MTGIFTYYLVVFYWYKCRLTYYLPIFTYYLPTGINVSNIPFPYIHIRSPVTAHVEGRIGPRPRDDKGAGAVSEFRMSITLGE